jgi:hypothetical protein
VPTSPSPGRDEMVRTALYEAGNVLLSRMIRIGQKPKTSCERGSRDPAGDVFFTRLIASVSVRTVLLPPSTS